MDPYKLNHNLSVSYTTLIILLDFKHLAQILIFLTSPLISAFI